MSDLSVADIQKLLRYATPEELAEIDALLQSDPTPWTPLPGPQMMAYESEADITGYGGAAGGGKTDLLAGLVLTRHKRALIVRREKAQTEGVVQRLEEIVGNKDGYNSQKGYWKLPDVGCDGMTRSGGLVEFAGLDNPGDERRWQGRPHDLKCVGAGTPIWMADGSMKPVEEVRVGDEVYTLLGPRRVTRTMSARRPAVSLRVGGYQQVQAADHPVLLGPYRFWSASPKQYRFAPLCGRKFGSTSPSAPPLDGDRHGGRPTARVSRPGAGLPRSWLATFCGAARTALESAIEAFRGSRQVREQQVSPPCAGIVLLQRPSGTTVSGSPEQSASRGEHGAPRQSSLRGFLADCLRALRCGGGQLRLCATTDQPGQLRPGGAGLRTPTCSPADARRQTPKRSPRMWSWVHPYSSGTYETAHPARVASWEVEEVGVRALFDLTVEEANHYVAGPGIVNRNCFDEATEMREAQVRFIMGWTRSPDPSVRPRAILTFNPPTTTEGRWVIKFFAPWLDKAHPNPAKPGELRWFTTKGDDQDFEVPDGRTFVFDGDEMVYDFDEDNYTPEQIIKPKSRTFIPARLVDNPYYMATDYMSTLQSLPEPLRSQMLNGDFGAGMEDDAYQLIPTRWVELAQARWKPLDVKPEMTGMGVDVARGGKDETIISRRHGWWFDELLSFKGADTDDGPKVMAQTLAAQRDQAPIHIDVVGVGASPYDFLVNAKAQVYGVNVGEGSTGTDKSGRLTFFNLRSELWWRLREAFDPDANNGIAIPPCPKLLSDLCAPRWKPQGRVVKVESRDEIIKRIGRSPDRGSALILALIDTPKWNVMVAAGMNNREHDPFAYNDRALNHQNSDYDPLRSYR